MTRASRQPGRRTAHTTFWVRPTGDPRNANRELARSAGQNGQLERVLAAVRGLGALERVLAREAGVAVPLARQPDRLVDAAEREVRQRVAADLLGDLRHRAAVGDHLLARRHV